MLGQNLRTLRKERNLTLEQLANNLNERYQDKERTVNFNKGKLSKWENNKDQPYLSSARLLADYFGVTVDMLMGREAIDVSNHISSIYNQLNSERQTKVYNFAEHQLEEQQRVKPTVYVISKLSAGTGIINLDPTDTEEVEFDGYVPAHDLAFEVSGDSMTPMFKDGEIVFVEKTQDIRSGQIIAVQINEEAYIKKAYVEDNHLRLVSLNKEYEDIIANENDDIRVVGRVIL